MTWSGMLTSQMKMYEVTQILPLYFRPEPVYGDIVNAALGDEFKSAYGLAGAQHQHCMGTWRVSMISIYVLGEKLILVRLLILSHSSVFTIFILTVTWMINNFFWPHVFLTSSSFCFPLPSKLQILRMMKRIMLVQKWVNLLMIVCGLASYWDPISGKCTNL